MPPPQAPWTRRLHELVESGVHAREELISGSMAWVPEGHAFRVREYRLEQLANARGYLVRRGNPGMRSVVRWGARAVITSTLKSRVRDGAFIRRGDQYYLAERSDAT